MVTFNTSSLWSLFTTALDINMMVVVVMAVVILILIIQQSLSWFTFFYVYIPSNLQWWLGSWCEHPVCSNFPLFSIFDWTLSMAFPNVNSFSLSTGEWPPGQKKKKKTKTSTKCGQVNRCKPMIYLALWTLSSLVQIMAQYQTGGSACQIPQHHTTNSQHLVLLTRPQWVNSLRLRDEYIPWSPRSSLVQIRACCLFDAKPLSEPLVAYCQLDPWEQTSVKL